MNKGQIRSHFLALLNRNDCSNDLADTFIEQGLARIQRVLRVPSMEKAQSYTINSVTPDSLILPSDFLSAKLLYCDDTLLEYVDLGRFLGTSTSVGTPSIYTRIQGTLKIKPTPVEGTEVSLVYYGEIPDLLTDSTTNFVTEIAPELLVYASLVHASDYFVDERKGQFEESYGRVFSELMEQAYMTEMETSGMRIAPPIGLEY